MCWFWLKRKKTLTLPYPEEKPDLTATVDNTSARGLLSLWILKYQPSDPQFWQTIDLTITGAITNAAETISELKQVKVQPQFASPGVLAHELAYISYHYLSDQERADFNGRLTILKDDPMVSLVMKEHPYGKTNMVEAHAETFRFLGRQLPLSLWRFYPHLLP